MSNLTVDDWLNLAPCPPYWNPGLLYWTPYPVNLTEGEVQKIAERCNVPPKDKLIMSSSVRNASSVLLPVLVSVSVVLLGILIAVLVYSYKHKKHKTGDSCIQGSKCDLLEERQDHGNKGCDNDTYKELKTEELPHSDKINSQQGLQNLSHSYNINTNQGLQTSKYQTKDGKVTIENRAFP
ncbi:uncharacterized protein LOC133202559 [Saccostrea echinata]|uniref:uncharacterized protein LOC133202559 n=1 Tax=Saccostrea echinata TaxID=191078 RepID=UPI002A828F3C|nr:uncharacterized protein LOC133202559 [Saccostrea echinata]